jgi:hypothetical protein
MNFTAIGIACVIAMVAGTLGMLELGRHFGVRRMAVDPEGVKMGTTTIDAAVFGLLGLLIAFTFSGAGSRFDQRRTMIVDEANAIGTAWLRLDLLPQASQPALREKFRQYTETRLDIFRKIPEFTAVNKEMAKANSLQNDIWVLATAACRDSGSSTTPLLLLPAINEMFDVGAIRTYGVRMHPPFFVYLVLGLLLLSSSMLAGYGMATGKVRDWVHALIFVLIMGLAVYLIVDFEYPRVGLIRLESFDKVLIDLRQSMNP